MAYATDTTRRSLFAIAGAATLLPAAALAAQPTLSADSMVAEVSALIDMEARLNAASATDEEWDAWDARRDRLIDAVEALPRTAENMKAKALGFFLIHRGDLEAFMGDDPATDQRLAFQIVQIAMGAH